MCITKGHNAQTRFIPKLKIEHARAYTGGPATGRMLLRINRFLLDGCNVYIFNKPVPRERASERTNDPISCTKDFIMLSIRCREEEHSRFRAKGLFNYCHISLILSRNHRWKIFKLSVSGTPAPSACFLAERYKLEKTRTREREKTKRGLRSRESELVQKMKCYNFASVQRKIRTHRYSGQKF